MSRLKRSCVWLCVLLLLGALPVVAEDGGAVGSGAETPSIQITFSGDESSVPVVFELTEEMNGRWVWVQAAADAPLEAICVLYLPESEGLLHVLTPAAEEDAQTEMELTADFTDTEAVPLVFLVVSPVDGEVLWTGWLTISHNPRPADLPDVPTPHVWPDPTASSGPEPDPMPSVEPQPDPMPSVEPEPDPMPSVEPEPDPMPSVEPQPDPLPTVTMEPTQAPTAPPVTPQPTVLPTLPPTPQPTAFPTLPPPPSPAPTPVQRAGYALIIASNVNFRSQPGGAVIGRLQRGDVLYVNGQAHIGDAEPWHSVTVMETLVNGYVRADMARFMTPQEIADYLNRSTPRPTARPTPTPAVALGYARVVWQSVQLRGNPTHTAPAQRTLAVGSVVYVVGQAVDGYKNLWLYVRTEDGLYGYMLSSAIVMMTPAEIAEYLAALIATPRPTAQPTVSSTLDPSFSYVVVRVNNVNFRETPSGTSIRRVHIGTLATLLSETPVLMDGYGWYRVLLGEEIGYLRTDMVDVIQLRPTQPTSRPTATTRPTPAPTPSPTPRLLPTAGPTGVADKLRAAVDTARYTEYARAQKGPVAYAVRDFDSDKLAELLLITLDTAPGGAYRLQLNAWKLAGGLMEPHASIAKTPVLAPGTELQIVLFEQSGREMVYIAQRNKATQAAFGGVGLTLTDAGWVEIPLTSNAKNPVTLLLASVEAGRLNVEDYSGLSVPEVTPEEAEQERSALAALLRVMLTLVQSLANGNG